MMSRFSVEAMERFGSVAQLGAIVLAALAVLSLLSHVLSRMRPTPQPWLEKGMQAPPTMPSSIPFISSTLSFVFTPRRFMLRAGELLNQHLPVRVPLLLGDIYVVRGAPSILSLWKESAHSASTELHGFFFGLIFGMPSKATALYAQDNSGFGPKPHPESKVKPNNRIDHVTHQVLKEFLLSDSSTEIAPRYAARLERRFASLPVGESGVECGDLLEFFQMEMLRANIEMAYGTALLEIHPDFCKDFWHFSGQLYGFYRPFPRWTVPGAYAARARLLSALKEWQRRIVHGGQDEKGFQDAYWGPKAVRKWHARFLEMDGFDEDAVASLYLGIIWVSNYNFIISVFWMVLEVYRDRKLLAAMQASLTGVSPQSLIQDSSQFHLLQSVYAETLRLRAEAYITRRFPHREVVLGDKWVIPRNKICLASTHPAHQDAAVWNTRHGVRKLDTFWAERFLVYPSDPQSGPVDPSYRARMQHTTKVHKSAPAQAQQQEAHKTPYFSLDGLASSWIPYGGGPRACPGRHIAKQQILSTFVAFLQNFDIEIHAQEKAWAMDERSYGPGVQLPVGKVPFRLRRRS